MVCLSDPTVVNVTMDNTEQDVSENIQAGSANDMLATDQFEFDPSRKEQMDNNNQDVSENSQICLTSVVPATAIVGSGQSVRKKIYQCETCSYTTNRKFDLKRHNKTPCSGSKSGEKNAYECGRCGYKTTWSSNLKRHKLSERCQHRHRFTEIFWEGPWCVYSTQ